MTRSTAATRSYDSSSGSVDRVDLDRSMAMVSDSSRSERPPRSTCALRLVGRRADGYHLIDSLMVPISLFDELRHPSSSAARRPPTSSVSVQSDSAQLPLGADNLAHRAARLFLQVTQQSIAVDIHRSRKRIPVGSGLGGGSSDAAAVLLALNRLLGDPLHPAAACRCWRRASAPTCRSSYIGRPARMSAASVSRSHPCALGRHPQSGRLLRRLRARNRGRCIRKCRRIH